MQRRAFLGIFLALSVLGISVLPGCGGGGDAKSSSPTPGGQPALTGDAAGTGGKRIVILTNGNAPFWDAAVAGAMDGKQDFNLAKEGLEITIDRGDFKVETQLNKLRQYGSSTDIAAVGVSVMDAKSAAIVDELKKLKAAGIKIVTIDSDVDREASADVRFAYLGTDNIQAGQQLGKAAKGLLPTAKYAAFVGDKGAANATERVKGFQDAAGESFVQADYLGDAPDGDSKARSNVRDALSRNADLNLLVGIWSYNTPAIIDIVKQLGLREKIKIVGFDADPPAIDGMQAGQVDVMVVQNPYQMGYQGVRLLRALVVEDDATVQEMFPNHGQPGGDIYDTGLKVVVPDEGSPLKADLFDKNTQFLKLGEFREWLSKYKLTGS